MPAQAAPRAIDQISAAIPGLNAHHLEHIPLDLNRGDSLSGLVERVYRH